MLWGDEANAQLRISLPFPCFGIEERIKYLGFSLKPNAYGFQD
jgi:hypothetical protein